MSKDLKLAELYDLYAPLFTEKQRETMEMYYNSDLSLGEISEETGITRQAAFNCIQKCEARLHELENAMGLLQRNKEIRRKIDEITEKCKEDSRVAAMLDEIKNLL